ncbi:MAG: M56 family metallopeptidase [Lachnospiraceae bacterium]|nr:M56 family metallopeptidase [Lachnospiraceae bacterium]
MGEVLVKLLNMSIAASWLILVVCLLRVLLKRAPRWIICALWGSVAIRLICPVAIESEISLIPSVELVRMEQAQSGVIPGGTSGNDVSTDVTDGQQAKNVATSQGQSGNTFSRPAVQDNGAQQTFTVWDAAGIVWLIGACAIIGMALIHFIKLKRSLQEAVPLRENIWICDAVTSPFILGIGKPRIYLSSSMDEAQMESVIAHENAHIRRFDPLWKLMGYLLLAVYWFNPLNWLAYHFLCKDIELACDEKVIRTLPLQKKKEYCQALLACSTQKHTRLSYPLAFGEIGVKDRVKNVLNYKKPQLWVILVAVVVCAVVCVCFLTNPREMPKESTEEYNLEAYETAEVVPATVTEDTLPGADSASLDFINGSRVIFHDYYGLFVYDFEKQQMIASLDLATIGCDKTQGDEFCEVTVDEAGEEIYLHVMGSPDMLVFTPDKETLEKRLYSMEGISVFGGLVDIMEYLQPDNTIFRTAYGGLLKDKNDTFYVAVLESGSGLPIDMAVVFYEWEGDGTLSGIGADDYRMIFREDDSGVVSREYESAKQIVQREYENEKQAITEQEQKASGKYTDEELKLLAGFYYRIHSGSDYQPSVIDIDSESGDSVLLHLYDNVEDHSTTLARYEIDRKTGKGQETVTFQDVDLTEVLFFLDLLKSNEALAIPCLYADEDYVIFSVGTIEGSMGVFSGKYYVYNRSKAEIEAEADLTDIPEFEVIGQYIYYQKYRAIQSSYGDGLYRTDFGLTTEEAISPWLEIVWYDREHDVIFAAKQSEEDDYRCQLVVISPDGTEEAVLLDPAELFERADISGWEYEDYDKVQYSEFTYDGSTVCVTVQHIGYREGISIGWRDALLDEERFELSYQKQ